LKTIDVIVAIMIIIVIMIKKYILRKRIVAIPKKRILNGRKAVHFFFVKTVAFIPYCT